MQERTRPTTYRRVARLPRRIVLAIASAISTCLLVAAPRVVVEPRESEEVFANPGMGWQTFHRFADEDRALEGLPSSSAYFRFYWRELEPREGETDFAKLDGLLAHARRAGQRLCFRVMCTGSGEYLDVPQWLKEQGGKGFEFEYGGGRHWVPDFEDAIFQRAHFRLIRELGQRYGKHPDVDLVDIGSVGLWGEWHMSQTKVVGSGEPVPLPSLQTRLTIIDACRDAFPAKAKVMLIGDIEGMRHAVQNGCGWRADCLGDMGGFSKNWNHMRDLYPQHVQQAGAGEVWKQGPVAFESCWDMQKWKREGWDVRHIFDYALGMHVSYMNNKSAPIPDGTRGEVERFLRKIGYRLVLRRLEHEARVKTGEKLAVSMGWENVGVAPPYGDHLVAFRLARQGEAKEKAIVSVGKTSIRGWLPGKKEVAESVAVPSKLAAGTCELAVAVVEPLTDEPAVRLANLGRDPAGWYPVSRVEVTEAE